MNRQDLIAAVAKRASLTRARATELVDLIFGDDGVIAGELRRGGKVQISGFGTFETRERKARPIRLHPRRIGQQHDRISEGRKAIRFHDIDRQGRILR